MSLAVCTGATLKCSCGMAPATLTVLPINRVLINNLPAATIEDCEPMVNITPFGMCISEDNPMVALATDLAEGALTPMPCIPVPAGLWVTGSPTALIANLPALTNDSTLMCQWGGSIQIEVAGQTSVMVGGG